MRGLPYFKFDVEFWTTSNVKFLSKTNKAIFVDLLARYWQLGGDVANDNFLYRHLECTKSDLESALNDFIELGLVYIDGANIRIAELDKQLAERKEIARINAENGKKGGKAKQQNRLVATAKQSFSDRLASAKQPLSDRLATANIIEENRIEEKRKEENINNAPACAYEQTQTQTHSVIAGIDSEIEKLGNANAKSFRDWLNMYRYVFNRDLSTQAIIRNLKDLINLNDPARVATLIDAAIKGQWRHIPLQLHNYAESTGQGGKERQFGFVTGDYNPGANERGL